MPSEYDLQMRQHYKNILDEMVKKYNSRQTTSHTPLLNDTIKEYETKTGVLISHNTFETYLLADILYVSHTNHSAKEIDIKDSNTADIYDQFLHASKCLNLESNNIQENIFSGCKPNIAKSILFFIEQHYVIGRGERANPYCLADLIEPNLQGAPLQLFYSGKYFLRQMNERNRLLIHNYYIQYVNDQFSSDPSTNTVEKNFTRYARLAEVTNRLELSDHIKIEYENAKAGSKISEQFVKIDSLLAENQQEIIRLIEEKEKAIVDRIKWQQDFSTAQTFSHGIVSILHLTGKHKAADYVASITTAGFTIAGAVHGMMMAGSLALGPFAAGVIIADAVLTLFISLFKKRKDTQTEMLKQINQMLNNLMQHTEKWLRHIDSRLENIERQMLLRHMEIYIILSSMDKKLVLLRDLIIRHHQEQKQISHTIQRQISDLATNAVLREFDDLIAIINVRRENHLELSQIEANSYYTQLLITPMRIARNPYVTGEKDYTHHIFENKDEAFDFVPQENIAALFKEAEQRGFHFPDIVIYNPAILERCIKTYFILIDSFDNITNPDSGTKIYLRDIENFRKSIETIRNNKSYLKILLNNYKQSLLDLLDKVKEKEIDYIKESIDTPLHHTQISSTIRYNQGIRDNTMELKIKDKAQQNWENWKNNNFKGYIQDRIRDFNKQNDIVRAELSASNHSTFSPELSLFTDKAPHTVSIIPLLFPSVENSENDRTILILDKNIAEKLVPETVRTATRLNLGTVLFEYEASTKHNFFKISAIFKRSNGELIKFAEATLPLEMANHIHYTKSRKKHPRPHHKPSEGLLHLSDHLLNCTFERPLSAAWIVWNCNHVTLAASGLSGSTLNVLQTNFAPVHQRFSQIVEKQSSTLNAPDNQLFIQENLVKISALAAKAISDHQKILQETLNNDNQLEKFCIALNKLKLLINMIFHFAYQDKLLSDPDFIKLLNMATGLPNKITAKNLYTSDAFKGHEDLKSKIDMLIQMIDNFIKKVTLLEETETQNAPVVSYPLIDRVHSELHIRNNKGSGPPPPAPPGPSSKL